MARKALAAKDVRSRVAKLEGWSVKGKAIEKAWSFEDYAHALIFTNAIAHLAEQHDHHPDVLLSYDAVRVTLSTHDAGGLTAHDFDLARAIDSLPLKWYGKPSG